MQCTAVLRVYDEHAYIVFGMNVYVHSVQYEINTACVNTVWKYEIIRKIPAAIDA
jgi:hypothetical protein